MKIYLHYEGSPDHTKVIKVPNARPQPTVAEALNSFIAEYHAKHRDQDCPPDLRDLSLLAVRSSKGKVVALTAQISSVFADKEDAYVIAAAPDPAAVSQPIMRDIACDFEAQYQDSQACSLVSSMSDLSMQHPKARVAGQPSASNPSSISSVLQSAMQQAEAAVKSRNLRAAEALYRELYKLVPDDAELLSRMARLWIEAGRGEKAVPLASRAAELKPDDIEVYQLLGEAHL